MSTLYPISEERFAFVLRCLELEAEIERLKDDLAEARGIANARRGQHGRGITSDEMTIAQWCAMRRRGMLVGEIAHVTGWSHATITRATAHVWKELP